MNSFSFWVPAGWTRLDLTGDVEATVHDALAPLVRATAPSRQPEARRLLFDAVGGTVRLLAERGAICALLLLDPTDPDPVRPVVAIRPIDLGEGEDPLEFAAALARRDPSARLVDVPGLIAVRSESSQDVTEQFRQTYAEAVARVSWPVPTAGSRADAQTLTAVRVSYVIGDPEAVDRWLTVELALEHPSGLGGETLRDGAVALFDAIVSTFRWPA